jgi:hypothetical protein
MQLYQSCGQWIGLRTQGSRCCDNPGLHDSNTFGIEECSSFAAALSESPRRERRDRKQT